MGDGVDLVGKAMVGFAGRSLEARLGGIGDSALSRYCGGEMASPIAEGRQLDRLYTLEGGAGKGSSGAVIC